MTLLDHLPSLRHAATPRVDPAVWPLTARVDDLGRLGVGGLALTDVADEFGTPAYVLDERDFRSRMRRYRTAMPQFDVAYAGKSLLTTTIARWVAEAGLGLDVSSSGELATALAGGTDPERIILHGNAKPFDELRVSLALASGRDGSAAGVGRVVVDSLTEIALLACATRRRLRVLIRVVPGIDTRGHAAVATGVVDQKFGLDTAGGDVDEAVHRILGQPNLELTGLHCHIGSQVTDPVYYAEAVHRMIAAMADIRARTDVLMTELNIGGGHGIPYTSGDRELDPREFADVVDDALDCACAKERFPRPRLVVEPGRAISARAGVTLYRVVSIKSRPGGRTFAAVDGGMSDNPRVTMYGAKYAVALANRHSIGPSRPVTIAGRHCEAGDEIARDVDLPADLRPGDLLAVAGTGAYQHSMASNYNMVCRPPVVAVRDGRATALVRRETLADLLVRDTGWSGGAVLGNDQHTGRLDADGHGLPDGERAGL